MIPLRTGVVRDIRIMVYSKVMHLPLGFFSQERKGDIIARMSGDVGEIENSITSSLDMLLKNPILILFYHRSTSRNGVADGKGRQEAETPIFGSAGQME